MKPPIFTSPWPLYEALLNARGSLKEAEHLLTRLHETTEIRAIDDGEGNWVDPINAADSFAVAIAAIDTLIAKAGRP